MIGLGLRARRGGAVAVAVTVADRRPRSVTSGFVATHEADDPLSLAPYGTARAMIHMQGASLAEAAAAVAAGRARQAALAAGALSLLDRPDVAALLVNRAGWIDDLLGHALGWAEHVPVVEGLAVRDALRAGLRVAGIATVEFDETGLADRAAEILGLSPEAIAAELAALGALAGKPWRKEQKAAALAGWVAAVQTAAA